MSAAVALADLAQVLGGDMKAAAGMALANRVELLEVDEIPVDQVVDDLVAQAEKKSPASPSGPG